MPCHAAVFFLHRPLDGNTCLPQVHGWAPLQVLHGGADADTDVLFPVSGGGSYVAAGGCFLSSLFLQETDGVLELSVQVGMGARRSGA